MLPLAFSDKNNYIEQIVRIPYEESKCFKTKARVPYLIIVETVDLNEEEPLEEEKSVILSPPTEILFRLNIKEIRSIEDKNNPNFEGFPELVKKSSKDVFENLSTDLSCENLINP